MTSKRSWGEGEVRGEQFGQHKNKAGGSWGKGGGGGGEC